MADSKSSRADEAGPDADGKHIQTLTRSRCIVHTLTSIHILGCDADAVVVVEQRRVAVVWNDVVL